MTEPRKAAEKVEAKPERNHEARLAFGRALTAIKPIKKSETADTGKYSYSYASLEVVLDECKRACAEQELVIAQIPTVIDGYLALELELHHANGGVMLFAPLMMVLPKEAQPFGSALTYARRYQLLTVFGIAPEDDDGKAATVAGQTQPGRRTEAERMIREQIAGMTPEDRGAFTEQFKFAFGMGLTELPASRHGDALTWARSWTPPPPPAPDPQQEKPQEDSTT